MINPWAEGVILPIGNLPLHKLHKIRVASGFTIEFLLQVNYLGHFLLILHLLPVLRNSGKDCRIILVSSSGHMGGELNMGNIQAQKCYDGFRFYLNSKLFQVNKITSIYSLHLPIA